MALGRGYWRWEQEDAEMLRRERDRLRAECGVGRKWMAEMMGVSWRTIKRMEEGPRLIHGRVAEAWLRYTRRRGMVSGRQEKRQGGEHELETGR